jgi:hypothetical protein
MSDLKDSPIVILQKPHSLLSCSLRPRTNPITVARPLARLDPLPRELQNFLEIPLLLPLRVSILQFRHAAIQFRHLE